MLINRFYKEAVATRFLLAAELRSLCNTNHYWRILKPHSGDLSCWIWSDQCIRPSNPSWLPFFDDLALSKKIMKEAVKQVAMSNLVEKWQKSGKSQKKFSFCHFKPGTGFCDHHSKDRDMRKGFDGLGGLVTNKPGQNPFLGIYPFLCKTKHLSKPPPFWILGR